MTNIIISKPRVSAPDGSTIDALNYELAGLFIVKHIGERFSIEDCEDYFKHGHPRAVSAAKIFGSKVAPGLVEKLDNKNPSEYIGVFFATSEINPGCLRPLISSKDLVMYRDRFKAVQFNVRWTSLGQLMDMINRSEFSQFEI